MIRNNLWLNVSHNILDPDTLLSNLRGLVAALGKDDLLPLIESISIEFDKTKVLSVACSS